MFHSSGLNDELGLNCERKRGVRCNSNAGPEQLDKWWSHSTETEKTRERIGWREVETTVVYVRP